MLTAKEIGSRVRDARKAAGLTQQALAESLKVDQTSISKWELGAVDMTVQQLQQLAETLRCSVGDLTAPASSDSGTHPAVDPDADRSASEPPSAAGNA